MPYKVSWFLEDRILLSKVWGENTDNELAQYDVEMNALLDQSTAQDVYLMFDALQADSMPSVMALKSFTFPKHPRFRYTVILKSSNRLINFVASAITQIFNTHVYFANSIDDALQYFQDLLPDLPDLEPYRHLLEKDPTLARKPDNIENS